MFDEGTQTTAAYPSDLNIAKAAQPSPLAQLIDTQEKTKHLLQVLGEKLAPVSNPHPVEARDVLNREMGIDSRATGAYLIDRYHEIWGNNSLGRLKR